MIDACRAIGAATPRQHLWVNCTRYQYYKTYLVLLLVPGSRQRLFTLIHIDSSASSRNGHKRITKIHMQLANTLYHVWYRHLVVLLTIPGTRYLVPYLVRTVVVTGTTPTVPGVVGKVRGNYQVIDTSMSTGRLVVVVRMRHFFLSSKLLELGDSILTAKAFGLPGTKNLLVLFSFTS